MQALGALQCTQIQQNYLRASEKLDRGVQIVIPNGRRTTKKNQEPQVLFILLQWQKNVCLFIVQNLVLY